MATKTIRYVGLFQRGGTDEDGSEHGDRLIKKFEWDADLERIAKKNRMTTFSCVEQKVDTQTHQVVETVHCVHYSSARAKKFLEVGIHGGEAIAEAFQKGLEDRVVIRSDPETDKLLKDATEIIAKQTAILDSQGKKIEQLEKQIAEAKKAGNK